MVAAVESTDSFRRDLLDAAEMEEPGGPTELMPTETVVPRRADGEMSRGLLDADVATANAAAAVEVLLLGHEKTLH